jgi:outer membrane immunogenic protein
LIPRKCRESHTNFSQLPLAVTAPQQPSRTFSGKPHDLSTSFAGETMHKAILGVFGAALGVLPAAAADMPVKAPPRAVAPAYLPWNGCYIGFNVGALIPESRHRVRADGDFMLPAHVAHNHQREHDHNFDDVRFTGGGQIGCNYQSGALVLGIETDAQWAGEEDNHRESRTFVAPLTGGITHDLSHRLEFWGSVRGRAGWAYNPTGMLYVTGGFAYARVEGHALSVFNDGERFEGDRRDFRTGWTVGAGWEYLFSPNWSFKAEYLFVDLGRFDHRMDSSRRANFAFRNEIDTQFHVARVGFNYRWGAQSPVLARY